MEQGPEQTRAEIFIKMAFLVPYKTDCYERLLCSPAKPVKGKGDGSNGR
jgi:hypothetical protein